MGIVNATKDVSEQKMVLAATIPTTKTGVDYPVLVAPHPLQISAAKSAVVGLSGTPTATLKLQRFVVGAGLTTISISSALTTLAIGTSGVQAFTLPAAGSSLLNLATGDVLVVTTGGANAGVDYLNVEVVVQALQDIKSYY